MQQPEPVSLDTAYKILAARTGRPWTRADFFTAVIQMSLPLVSTTPADTRPVIRYFDREHDARMDGPRPYAALLTSHIRDLSAHGEVMTAAVALAPWHDGYRSWEQIKNRRKEMNRAAHTPATWNQQWPDCPWSDGEIMGEDDTAYFSPPVLVTDATCRVPPETIQELICAHDQQLALQGTTALGDPDAVSVSTSMSSNLQVAQHENPGAEERMAGSSLPATADSPVQGGAVPIVKVKRHRLRRDALHVVIDKAIARAGNLDTADVGLQLRELALASEPPFTGEVQGNALMYTDEENKVVPLTRNALDARLRRAKKGKTGD